MFKLSIFHRIGIAVLTIIIIAAFLYLSMTKTAISK